MYKKIILMKKRPNLLSLTLCVSLALHGCLFFMSPFRTSRYRTAPLRPSPFNAFSLINLAVLEPPVPENPPPLAEPPPRPPPLPEPPAAVTDPAETFVALEPPPESAPPEPEPPADSPEPSAPPPPSPAQVYFKDNYAYIQRHIREKLVYPPEARDAGIQGIAELSFVIHPDGQVSNVQITKSSGSETLDASAVAAIYSAAPFRPPPSQARLVMPVAFRIR
jgi:protein TonB